MRISLKVLAIGAALAASATMASATLLTPGNTVTATPVAWAPGTILENTGIQPMSASTFSGNYIELVVKNDPNNIFNAQCSGGCLTFVFGVSNNASSQNGIEHVTDGAGAPGPVGPGIGFQYYSLNVGYETVPGGIAPLTVDESLFGGTVSFNFTGDDAIAPGAASDWLVVETNASNFVQGSFGAIDSSTATEIGFVPAPVSAVPEPGSIALLGTSLLGAAGLARRRMFRK